MKQSRTNIGINFAPPPPPPPPSTHAPMNDRGCLRQNWHCVKFYSARVPLSFRTALRTSCFCKYEAQAPCRTQFNPSTLVMAVAYIYRYHTNTNIYPMQYCTVALIAHTTFPNLSSTLGRLMLTLSSAPGIAGSWVLCVRF